MGLTAEQAEAIKNELKRIGGDLTWKNHKFQSKHENYVF